MINFIIYEDDKKFRNLYISTILKIIGNKNIAYEITEIEKYTNKTLENINKLCGKKIFILDIEVPGLSGIDLARLIRKNNDWDSQIIICTSHDKLIMPTLNSKLLILSYVSKFIECIDNLKESINIALKILENNQTLNYQYNGDIYQIPYKDILFIEKSSKTGIVHINTNTTKLEINKTMNEIEEILSNDKRFFRTHRSCIINIENISKFQINDMIINFKNKKTNLITRDKKKELKELLLREKLTYNKQ